MPNKKIKRALISVSNKTGVVELAQQLAKHQVEIISSDGTAALLRDSGVVVRTVTEVTGSPEILGGKVKTLHPAIHAALLVDQNDPAQLDELTILPPLDLLVINLYPVDGFDIGGPALTRAAAKNSEHVAVITNPNQYSELIATLEPGSSLQQRQQWAMAALQLTAQYDLALLKQRGEQLRYGENPQQSGVLINQNADQVLQGKAMSYNNYLDLDAAWKAAALCSPAVAIVKHGIPAGIANSSNATTALKRAWFCDPVSAFGSVVASTEQVDKSFAAELIKNFVEVVAAPDFSKDALELFSSKPNLRVVKINQISDNPIQIRSIRNGFLMQDQDSLSNPGDNFENWQLVTGSPVAKNVLQDLAFAWSAAAAARSNAVVIVRDLATIGIGAGSVSRVDAAKQAISHAKQHCEAQLKGSVAASDAFFPFPDGVQELAEAGVVAIVQPGGSVKDSEVIKAAQGAGIAMYLTGVRHFSH